MINYMKEHEYNPEHTHEGQLSWVIFLQTPDVSEEQRQYYKKQVLLDINNI